MEANKVLISNTKATEEEEKEAHKVANSYKIHKTAKEAAEGEFYNIEEELYP